MTPDDILKPRRLTTMRGITAASSPYGTGQQFRASFGPAASPQLGQGAIGPTSRPNTNTGAPPPPQVTVAGAGRVSGGSWDQGHNGPRYGSDLPGSQMFGPGGQWAGQGMWQRGGIGGRGDQRLPPGVIRPGGGGGMPEMPGREPEMRQPGGGFGDVMGRARMLAAKTAGFQPVPQPAQTAPAPIYSPQSINLNTGGAQGGSGGGGGDPGGGFGQSRHALEGEQPQPPPPPAPPPGGGPSVEGDWAAIVNHLQSKYGFRVDENGNIWDGNERIGNLWNDQILDPSRNPKGMKGDKYALLGGETHGPQDQDLLILLDRWHRSLGAQATSTAADEETDFIKQLLAPRETPQLNQNVVQGNVDAMRRQLAFEQAKALTMTDAMGGRARMNPEAMAGVSGNMMQQRAVAESAQEAQIRLQAEIQQFQAELHMVDQEIANARLAATFAQHTRDSAIAFAREKELQAYQASIIQKMQEAERKRTEWAQILGTIGTAVGAMYGGYTGGPAGAQAYSQIGGGFGAGVGGLIG